MKKGISSRKWIGALIAAFFMITAFFGVFPSLYNRETTDLVEAADSYASFKAGSSYTFTDRTKFITYRADVIESNSYISSGDDTTTVEVEITPTNHGTQKNPFVIDSFSTWKKFVDEMSVSESNAGATYGDGYVYALAVDLDFSLSDTEQATIMTSFNGTFYGLGHTIKNFNVTDTTSTTEATGLFRYGPWRANKRAVITDLNLEYSFTTTQQNVGGFFGRIGGSESVTLLNCHVKGTVTRNSTRDALLCVGGLLGNVWMSTNSGGAVYAYRCSSKLTVQDTYNPSPNTNHPGVYAGGIVGGSWVDYSLYVYDCYGDIEMSTTASQNKRIIGCGAILGGGTAASRPATNHGGIEIMRCAGKSEYNDINGQTTWRFGSLFSFYDGDNAATMGTFLVRDCYVYGAAKNHNTGFDGHIFPWVAYDTDNYNTVDALRVYYASRGSQDWGLSMGSHITNSNWGGRKSNSDLWTDLKSNANLNESIWTKTDLGESYSYTIATSPVRNRKFDESFKITYYNLKKNGNTYSYEPINLTAGTYSYWSDVANPQKKTLEDLTTAPSPHHKFLGWTTDKTGATTGTRSFDVTNYYGDIKVFAMWRLDDITPSLTQSGGTLNTATNTYEAESGGSGITVTANVSVPSDAMISAQNLSITYDWIKDGRPLTSHHNNKSVNVEDKTGDGTYSFQYSVEDKSMPLVKATGICSESITVEITGKSTSLNRFSPSVPVYEDMYLYEIPFTLSMVDGYTEVPAGEAPTWEHVNYQIRGGENTVNVIFTPQDTATYKIMTVPVTITPEPFTLTFNIASSNTSFVVNIGYKRDYSAQQIKDMFTAAYLERIKDDPAFKNSVEGRQPCLGDGTIQTDIDLYNTPFPAATTLQTIQVTFTDPKDYHVLLDYDYDDRTEMKTVHWNQFVTPPEIPDRGDEWKFDNWYVTKNGTVTEETWNFETQRVTSDLKLTAKWTPVVLTLKSLKVTASKNPFTVTALTPIKDLGITVEATYSSSVAADFTRVIPLKVGSEDGYEVKVGNVLNGNLHVNTTQIDVSYGGLTQSVPVTVTPISLDGYRDQIDFPVCTKDWTGQPQEIDELLITALPEQVQPYVRDIVISYARGGSEIPKSDVVEKDTYEAIATFITNEDYTLSPVSTSFIISAPRLKVSVVWTQDPAGYTYNGVAQYPKATLTVIEGSSNGTVLGSGMYEYTILNSSNGKSDGIDADTYTIKVVFTTNGAKSYKFDNVLETTTRYTVKKMKVGKPTAVLTKFTYAEDEKQFLLENFYSEYMSYSADSKRVGTDAGSYSVTVQLDKNHEWNEGGSTALYTWTIEKATISRPVFGEASVEYNGFEQDISTKLSGFDASKMQIANGKAKNAGSYVANVTPNSNYTWENATTAVSVNWTITKAKLSVGWEFTDTFRPTDETRYPQVTNFYGLKGEDKFDAETDGDFVRYEGANKSTVGGYVVKVSELYTSWADNYEIEDLGKGYRIIAADADPDDPNNPQVPDVTGNGSTNNQGNTNNGNNNGGSTGENPSGDTLQPLLQIILSGISLVLIVVFTVLTINYSMAAKSALAKSKKLALVSYSFAPVGLLAMAFGLSETSWWIIAGVLMAFALIMGIVAFMFRAKKLKAVVMLEEEQERIAEEKELAKEAQARDEQMRRDSELKMMFAAMQQNSQQPQMQPQFQMDDIRGLLAETVSALLPGLQQAMALPPAQGDAEYYSRANAETEELRKLMQQQQEQMAAQQEQMAQQQAQMAEQQDMINQLMQERQNAVAYEAYEEPVDDTSWVGEGEEYVSLEESYGNLSDEEKRYYYEIGSYIMNKPRTSQNDGKYAVLFKYRGRTLFKLCIKEDAPVLYYPLGDGGRGEVRIADPMSLELAKSVIDRYVIRVDSELA